YKDFLKNHLPILLDNGPLMIRQNIYSMHDGASPHFSRIARDFL
ncbi:hypothetical protein EAI_03850, partial [Harpegnathos saltator]